MYGEETVYYNKNKTEKENFQMWNTKTFKIVYYDKNVMYGDKRRSTLIEACNRSDAIFKFQQDFGPGYVIRDYIEL